MKRIRYINTWQFSLIFTLLYSSFIFYLFAELHPQGTQFDWPNFFFFAGAGLGTLFTIHVCYRIIRKKEQHMPAVFFYLLLFLLSLLLFPVFYGIYWGLLVNRLIYGGCATILSSLHEARLMVGVFQVPICFATVLGMYNEKVFRLNRDLVEKEKMLTETRLIQLQQQVDPHFLFNNLNILSALIRQSPGQAEVFSQRLSELYRYYLRSGREQLVTLAEELQYMHDYLFLLQCRFGNAFVPHIQKAGDFSEKELFIVTGTLQLLLENAVKHNSATAGQPLNILVKISSEELVMENEIRIRKAVSEGVGLKNLEHRYEILTGKKIIIENAGGLFRVQIPLIKQLKLSGT